MNQDENHSLSRLRKKNLKILFLYPDLNSNPNFKPLVNIANYLSSENNQIYIAIQGIVSETNRKSFCNSIIFINRRDKQPKLAWAYHLMTQDFDCMIGVQAHNAFWLSINKALFFRHKKVISWEHSSPITSLKNEYNYTWPLWLILRFGLSQSTDAFFCVSKGAVVQMENIIRSSKNKVFYTPNMIFNTNDLTDISNRTKNSTINIVSVGRLSKEKGLMLALQALSRLKNIDYNYLIVGDGPCYDELDNYVNSTPNLMGKVQFLGRREDVLSIMLDSDLILLPSYFEGLPTVLVEACITNTPIIAANCKTGPSEIVKEGVNGYLFEVGNSTDLYNKINLWINNRETIKNSSSYAVDYSETASVKFLKNIKEVVDG